MPQLTNPGYALARAITLSDTVNFDGSVSLSGGFVKPCDAIYVGTKGSTGTMVVVLQDGTTATFVGLTAGTIIPIRAIRVNNTTTDVSTLLALYATT